MSVSEIKLYKILKEKMGEEEAQSLVEYVELKIAEEFHDKQYVLATKQDLLVLKEELAERMNKQKEELIERMDKQKGELIERMDVKFGSLESKFNDLKVQVKADKVDMIKWMFIFWVGQLAAMITLFKLFTS